MDENHHIWKNILTGLLTFLGAFAAFYVVTDWHYKRMMDPSVQLRRMEKAMMREQRQMDRMARRAIHEDYKAEENVAKYVHVDRTPFSYKIIIDLKPFDNNDKNIEVSTDDNTLFINAAGEKVKKGRAEIVKYSQSFTFGDNADMDKMTKSKEGNFYVITIPFKK